MNRFFAILFFSHYFRITPPRDSLRKRAGPLFQSNVKTKLIVFISVSDSSSVREISSVSFTLSNKNIQYSRTNLMMKMIVGTCLNAHFVFYPDVFPPYRVVCFGHHFHHRISLTLKFCGILVVYLWYTFSSKINQLLAVHHFPSLIARKNNKEANRISYFNACLVSGLCKLLRSLYVESFISWLAIKLKGCIRALQANQSLHL